MSENETKDEQAKEPAPPGGDEGPPKLAPGPSRPPPKAWGEPLARFERAWARLEVKLAVGVLLAEILALCAWVSLKGMSTPLSANKAGVVFRAVLTAVVLGSAAWVGLKSKPERFRSVATMIAVAAGLFLGRAWASVGVQYSSEILNWYQDASSLTLIGGLRGVATRLTAWLAMLGASLATSSGKHINIDVVMRFLPERVRPPAAIAAWMAAAVVSLGAAWGFADFIAVADFHAPREASVGGKVKASMHDLGEQFFLLRKQISIDMKVGPRVFTGTRYTEALSGAEWNAHVREGGYEAWFPADKVKSIYVSAADEAKPKTPQVITFDKSPRGMMVETFNLIFPFGFLMIGLKFLLRSLLVLSGHVVVDPDAAHREDDEVVHEPAKEAT